MSTYRAVAGGGGGAREATAPLGFQIFVFFLINYPQN